MRIALTDMETKVHAATMKKPLIIIALLAGSLSAYAQGFINFADREPDMTIHIYAPQLANPSQQVYGDANASTGVPADIYTYNGVDQDVFNTGVVGSVTTGGSTVYTGGAIGNTNPGNPTPAGAYNYNNGSDFTVELYAAVGSNQPLLTGP